MSPKLFGPKSQYTTVPGPDILRNAIVLRYICYILPKQQIFRKYIIFPLLTK